MKVMSSKIVLCRKLHSFLWNKGSLGLLHKNLYYIKLCLQKEGRSNHYLSSNRAENFFVAALSGVWYLTKATWVEQNSKTSIDCWPPIAYIICKICLGSSDGSAGHQVNPEEGSWYYQQCWDLFLHTHLLVGTNVYLWTQFPREEMQLVGQGLGLGLSGQLSLG